MNTAIQAISPGSVKPGQWKRLLGNSALIAAVLYIALFAVNALIQPGPVSVVSINDLFNNTIPLALAAVGGTFVVLTRGFDLSVAGVIGLVNVCVATLVGEGLSGAFAGVALSVAIGLAVGLLNGVLVAYLRLQSIAATLSTMIMCSGLAIVVLDAPGGYVPDFISYNMTDFYWGFVPMAAIILAAVLVFWLVLRRTEFGIALYAVGADDTAAGLAGVAVARTRLTAYALAGVFYGLSGFMLSAVTATGSPSAGTPFLLLMFAAIAMGGTSFGGGQGGAVGSIIGAGTLVLLQKTLFSVGLPSFYTFVFQGVIMVVAVLVGGFSASLSTRAFK